ncbi:hypothetical protein IIB79_13210 [candidate division KSB1 bacterium]|nr:hypothetical protein [candidate division KSB1 bacterium]
MHGAMPNQDTLSILMTDYGSCKQEIQELKTKYKIIPGKHCLDYMAEKGSIEDMVDILNYKVVPDIETFKKCIKGKLKQQFGRFQVNRSTIPASKTSLRQR